MKKMSVIVAVTVLSMGSNISAISQRQRNDLPTKRETLKAMRIANLYFMNKWSDAGKEIYVESKHKTWPSNIWTRAVYYEGLMALYQVDAKKKYLNYAMQWGNAHHWNLRSGSQTRNADNQCAGQTYIEVALEKKDTALMSNIKASIDGMLSSEKKDAWTWIDAIQMSMPVFAKLGAYTCNKAYYQKMWEMYHYTRSEIEGRGLYDTENHLWWRDKDFMPPYKEPNGKDCYWSRGNGWVCAALIRVLDILPKDDMHYPDYLQDYKEMMHALLRYQNAEGYWNVSLADSTHFGGKELTGTALFTYAMSWGLNHRLLDKQVYESVVARAWNCILTCVHPNGFLGYVQGTGKEPKDSQPVNYDEVPDFEDFGLGCFLMAGSEVYKLCE